MSVRQVNFFDAIRLNVEIFCAFEIRPEITNIVVTRGNISHWKRIYLQKHESSIFKLNVKAFRNSPEYSFASVNNDNNKFKAMFPDSKTTGSYIQGETKTKYVNEHGIAPYYRKRMLHDIMNQSFTFTFDENTKRQIKKQYDGYVQFWSANIREIVIKYCGSVFVGHCTSKQLFDHFLDFC